jgi:hypothetical protein
MPTVGSLRGGGLVLKEGLLALVETLREGLRHAHRRAYSYLWDDSLAKGYVGVGKNGK